MALLDGKPNKGGPLEAWAAVSPDEGVRTRRRSAKIEAATLSQTQLSEQSPESLDKENEVQQPERSLSRKSDNSAVITTELWEGNKPARGLHFPKATLRPCTKPLWSLRSVSPAVTTCNDDVSVSGSNTDKAFQIYEDPDVKVGSSPRNTPDSIKTISEHCTVLEPEVLEQMLTPPTEICAVEHNNNLSVDDNSSDSSDSDDSEMDSTSSAEAMNQLKATNEDLTAENKYYRLLADITTKPAALRRGCE